MSDAEPAPSLRERKRQQTRARISGAATMLFLTHGFDRVTVAEVAAAAECSTMTVFNYFPRKEDLFLDRIPEAVTMFEQAVRERPCGTSPVAAVHALLLEMLAAGHPLVAMRDDFSHFWRVVLDAPSLRARAREGVEEVEQALAAAIAETSEDPHPRLTAALTVAAYRSVYLAMAGRILAGEGAAGLAARQRALLDRTFAVLETACAEIGRPE